MSQSRTINLTSLNEENYLNDLLKTDYNYDEDIKERCLLKRHYNEQRRLLEATYEDIFERLNETILNDIKRFVEKCLDTREEHLFVGEDAECIFGSILNLNMQISDHEPTFNLIQRKLKSYKNLHVTRIKVNNIKKRNLLDVLEPSKQSKRVFIMIEQAETLTRSVTDVLVGHLKNRIEDETSPTSVIMVLFCLSTRMQEMPFDHVNCFGRMTTITKDRTSENREILDLLLRNENLRMKLAFEPAQFIYDYFVNVDASLASVLYLMNYALFEHYYKLENDYITLDKKQMIALLGPSHATDRHLHLCDEMGYFFELLGEKDLYPADVLDIYEDLNNCSELTNSTQFVDSVQNLRKFSREALLKRMERVMKRSHKSSEKSNGKLDVISILLKHRDKICNNDDCDNIRKALSSDLLGYASQIKNPTMNDIDRVYFRDRETLINSTLTAVREEDTLVKYFCRDNTYFGTLLRRHILTGQGQLGVHDLEADVEAEFKDIIRLDRSCLKKTSKTKKSKIRNARLPDQSDGHGLSPEEEDGLCKALFVDMIDCMELQYFIKLDRSAKCKHLKRLVWPSLD